MKFEYYVINMNNDVELVSCSNGQELDRSLNSFIVAGLILEELAIYTRTIDGTNRN